jgi:hypothetical protein
VLNPVLLYQTHNLARWRVGWTRDPCKLWFGQNMSGLFSFLWFVDGQLGSIRSSKLFINFSLERGGARFVAYVGGLLYILRYHYEIMTFRREIG